LEAPEGKVWREDPEFAVSMPTMLTAIVRKQELREKVDVNFDGRISFLEYLLYQYREFCNPADFCERSMRVKEEGEHPEITKARALLEDVNAAIRAYETEKTRLQEDSKLPGVRGLTAKHTFAQLASSPLAEKLNTALIKAEAAVRKAMKLYGPDAVQDEEAQAKAPSQGTLYWMNADLDVKKKLYGRRAVAGHAVSGSSSAPKAGTNQSKRSSLERKPAPATPTGLKPNPAGLKPSGSVSKPSGSVTKPSAASPVKKPSNAPAYVAKPLFPPERKASSAAKPPKPTGVEVNDAV